jgi:uncharacterized damage-inducible protein DinB
MVTPVADALEQLDFVRRYTLERLNTVPLEEWFVVPAGSGSHIAWQVGHIAAAEYRLCLERLRGRTEADELLIPFDFLQQFSRTSTAQPPGSYSASDIRQIFDAVHERIMRELPAYPLDALQLPPLTPHPLCTTRLACLRYAPLHEMLHCGQIGLLRRMLGHAPLW